MSATNSITRMVIVGYITQNEQPSLRTLVVYLPVVNPIRLGIDYFLVKFDLLNSPFSLIFLCFFSETLTFSNHFSLFYFINWLMFHLVHSI